MTSMNDSDAQILKAITGGDTSGMTEEWLLHMKETYPFFPLTEALELQHKGDSMTPRQRRDAMSRIAISLGDTGAAASIIDPDSHNGAFYPPQEEPARPSTENTIEKFLSTYGSTGDNETATLEKLIFNPVADYSQQLARDAAPVDDTADVDSDSQEARINRFILSMKDSPDGDEEVPVELPQPPAPEPAETPRNRRHEKRPAETPLAKAPEQPADNSLLSESLAKIYIKTKRYEHAYEILNRLSLAFPEKNAYFADQLRFLRKLMLAESYRKKRIKNQNDSEK